MILDSYFAIACVLLLAALVFAASEASAAQRAKGVAENLRDLSIREAEGYLKDAKLWREAYEARTAQLAEARTRIDTLEGELTAADIALSQARKNDHRDAKGRFAKAA